MKSKAKKRKPKTIKNIIVFLLIITAIMGSISFLETFFGAGLNDEKIKSPSAKAKVLDSQGEEVLYHSSLNEYTEYKDISPNIVNAFVALEDKRFFRHKGVDFYRIGGALVHNIKAGCIKEGASTISQQLAKNTQLDSKKTLERKLKEVRIARQIEKKYKKEAILEMYLNAIYFGNGIYGIDKACKTLFDKEPKDIEIAEAAMLAGIVRSPNSNSPLNNLDNAQKRMSLTLNVMLKNDFINATDYNTAIKYSYQKPVLDENNKYSGKYAIAAIAQAAKILGITEKALIENNFVIHTYMDKSLQQSTDRAIAISALKNEKTGQEIPGYILVVDNNTFGVSAFSANFDYNIFLLRRQPGSCIKPIISYTPALEQGLITPASIVIDQPKSYNGYNPKNYRGTYYGRTYISTAVSKSLNSVPVALLNDLGLNYSMQVASDMGLYFTGGDNNLALGLGGMQYGVTPLEITQAYATLASLGKNKAVNFISRIYGPNGELHYENTSAFKQAITPSVAYLMTDMLRGAVASGTARKLSSLGYQVAAKTGTVGYSGSELNSDAWCMSYTTAHTVSVWCGNLTQKAESRLPKSFTGGAIPTLISKYVYENLYTASKPKDFSIPSNIVMLDIDLKARDIQDELFLASPQTPAGFSKAFYFDIKNAPFEYSTLYDITMPEDFSVNLVDGVPKVSFTALRGQKYQIAKEYLDTKTIVTQIEGHEGHYEYFDEQNADSGLVRYRLIIENEYGGIEETSAQSVLLSSYERKFQFQHFQWRW